MGRETKILLGLLGLLAGVFMGVLSMKLFVPRPPAGAGPDIHTELAAAEPHDIVEPPGLAMHASDFAAAPPLVPASAPGDDATSAAADQTAPRDAGDRYASRESVFAPAAADVATNQAALSRRDPFVTAASFEPPHAAESVTNPVEPPATSGSEADLQRPIPLDAAPPMNEQSVAQPSTFPSVPSTEPMQAAPPVPLAGGHVAQPGDTWWSLAERAYGDGRLYRALHAWNRSRDPRITLAPGTPLQLPPHADLAAAWPQLIPARP